MREGAVLGVLALVLAGVGAFFLLSLDDEGDPLRISAEASSATDEGGEGIRDPELDPAALMGSGAPRGTSRKTEVIPELGHHVTLVFRDQRGELVPGVGVRLRDANDASRFTRLRETDSAGKVTFRKLPERSSYFVVVESTTHYMPGSLRVLALPQEHQIDARAFPYAVIAGEIRDEEGLPQEGIIVGMIGAENVRTDRAGRFRMTRVREDGRARLLVALSRMADFAASTEVPIIEAGSQNDGYMMLLLPSGRLEGRVTDYRDQALSDVDIRIPLNAKRYAKPWAPVLTAAAQNGAFRFDANRLFASTKSDGTYAMPLPWATNYVAAAEKEKWFCRGSSARIRNLAQGEIRRQDFVMNQGGALAGPLVWPAELPAEGQVVVEAQSLGKKKLTRVNRIDPSETWYIDGLPAGEYAVRVSYEVSPESAPVLLSADGRLLSDSEKGNGAYRELRNLVGLASSDPNTLVNGAATLQLKAGTATYSRSSLVFGSAQAPTSSGSPAVPGEAPSPVDVRDLDMLSSRIKSLETGSSSADRSGREPSFEEQYFRLIYASDDGSGGGPGAPLLIGEISGVTVQLDASQDDLAVELRDVVVVRGEVRDETGRAAVEVSIDLYHYSSFKQRSRSVRTDEKGRFEVRGWTGGKYRVRASGSRFLGRVERKFDLFAGDSRREDFVLERGLVVIGVVIAADGSPAARVSVWLNQNSSESTTTDQKGRFRFAKVKPGKARLYTRAGGKSGQDFSERLEIEVLGDVANVRLVMQRSHVIEGLLLDREGRPRPKVKVTAQARDNNGLKRTGTTDAEGRFAIRGCYPGPYTVSAPSASPAKRSRNKRRSRAKATTAVSVDVTRSGAPFLNLRDR